MKSNHPKHMNKDLYADLSMDEVHSLPAIIVAHHLNEVMPAFYFTGNSNQPFALLDDEAIEKYCKKPIFTIGSQALKNAFEYVLIESFKMADCIMVSICDPYLLLDQMKEISIGFDMFYEEDDEEEPKTVYVH